jgi:hypothetical protein
MGTGTPRSTNLSGGLSNAASSAELLSSEETSLLACSTSARSDASCELIRRLSWSRSLSEPGNFWGGWVGKCEVCGAAMEVLQPLAANSERTFHNRTGNGRLQTRPFSQRCDHMGVHLFSTVGEGAIALPSSPCAVGPTYAAQLSAQTNVAHPSPPPTADK